MWLGKSKKSLIVMTSMLVISTCLAACGSNSNNGANNSPSPASTEAPTATAAPTERTLTDGLGHEVTIPANPQRIIASYLEDSLVALGVKPVAQWSVPNGIQDYLQDSLEGIPTISWDLPFEQVTSFDPDLIIVDSAETVSGDKYDQYAKIAPTFTIGAEENNDWRQELLKVGEILGKSEEAQKVLDTYEAKAADAKKTLEGSISGQSAAAIWLVQKQFFMVSENLSTGAVLYKDLGLEVPEVVKEISASGTSNWLPISLEKLAQLDADHLFLINSDTDSGSEALQDPIWQSIPAVKNGHLYEYPSTASWLYTGAIANTQMIDNVLDSLVK